MNLMFCLFSAANYRTFENSAGKTDSVSTIKRTFFLVLQFDTRPATHPCFKSFSGHFQWCKTYLINRLLLCPLTSMMSTLVLLEFKTGHAIWAQKLQSHDDVSHTKRSRWVLQNVSVRVIATQTSAASSHDTGPKLERYTTDPTKTTPLSRLSLNWSVETTSRMVKFETLLSYRLCPLALVQPLEVIVLGYGRRRRRRL